MKKKFLCVALSAMMLLPAVPIHINANIRMYRNDHLKMYKITL